jgi:hypothetical protein
VSRRSRSAVVAGDCVSCCRCDVACVCACLFACSRASIAGACDAAEYCNGGTQVCRCHVSTCVSRSLVLTVSARCTAASDVPMRSGCRCVCARRLLHRIVCYVHDKQHLPTSCACIECDVVLSLTRVRTQGTVCRQAGGPCDQAAQCTGTSASCAPNVLLGAARCVGKGGWGCSVTLTNCVCDLVCVVQQPARVTWCVCRVV